MDLKGRSRFITCWMIRLISMKDMKNWYKIKEEKQQEEDKLKRLIALK